MPPTHLPHPPPDRIPYPHHLPSTHKMQTTKRTTRRYLASQFLLSFVPVQPSVVPALLRFSITCIVLCSKGTLGLFERTRGEGEVSEEGGWQGDGGSLMMETGVSRVRETRVEGSMKECITTLLVALSLVLSQLLSTPSDDDPTMLFPSPSQALASLIVLLFVAPGTADWTMGVKVGVGLAGWLGAGGGEVEAWEVGRGVGGAAVGVVGVVGMKVLCGDGRGREGCKDVMGVSPSSRGEGRVVLMEYVCRWLLYSS